MGKTEVLVSWSGFNPEGQEMDDPGKAVIFLPGWPWPYRILYYINQDGNTIFITSILHRQGAYK